MEKKYVVLRGIIDENWGNRFYCNNVVGTDPTVMDDGTVAYEILGYGDTAKECLHIILTAPRRGL